MQIEKAYGKLENMKNKIVVSSIAIIILLISCLYIFMQNNMTGSYTIEKITKVNFDKISYVMKGGAREQNEKVTLKDFNALFKNVQFKRANASQMGDQATCHTYYVCYDKNDIVLYTIEDIGNRNLYYIGRGKFNVNNPKGFKLYEAIAN